MYFNLNWFLGEITRRVAYYCTLIVDDIIKIPSVYFQPDTFT